MRRIAAPLAALIALATAVFAAEPPLNTPYEDAKVGARESERAGAALGLVEGEAINAYVAAIGNRLAKHAPGYAFDYRFAIVDDTAPNAFALPGGYVFVSRGLLTLSNSEDELAGVIGHEIAHAALRHSAAKRGAGNPTMLAPMTFVSVMSFSRDLERSADRVGQGLAGVAGYDPGAITRFLESLDSIERLHFGASRIPSFLDTHPGTAQRISETSQRASGIKWKPRKGIAGGRAGHLRRIEGLVVGESGSQGVFRGTRFLHPDLGFTLRFPRGWEVKNTPRAVGAIDKKRNGQIFLEHAMQGEDPAAAARKWIEEGRDEGLSVDSQESIKLVGREAYRVTGTARTQGAFLKIHATFLPFRGSVYRIVGVSLGDRHEALFVNVARTFRPMTPELLADVKELKLRLAEAQPGDDLGAIATRSGSDWGAGRLAVLNGVQTSASFKGGELVKIVKTEAYLAKDVAAR